MKNNIRHIRFLFLTVFIGILLFAFSIASNAVGETTHAISDASEIVGTDASLWSNFSNGDTIDISDLSTTELGKIIVPSHITSLKIKGSIDKTYTKFNVTSDHAISLIVENVNASSSTGTSSFYFSQNAQNEITIVGSNSFVASNNSKCIVGNVTFLGNGNLTIASGKTTSSSNLAHGILGNVILDHTGAITISSGSGNSGTSSSYNGLNAGDAICGNVECKNSGSVTIKGGSGGSCYTNSSAAGSTAGNGGSGISGNLLCSGNGNITISGGMGGSLSLRGVSYRGGLSGSGVIGNVIIKGSAEVIISGGQKKTSSSEDGYGILGYLKVYDGATVTVNGGDGYYSAYNKLANAGIGIYGDVYMYNHSVLLCTGGNGGRGNNGNNSYPSQVGNGGDGQIGIVGDVYLYDASSLTCYGGDGGDGGDVVYTSGSPTFGTSSGGDGATAIKGNIKHISTGCSVTAQGGDGGDGGRAKTSNAGNAGSGIVGDIFSQPNITLIVSPGKAGTKYYSATSGTVGSNGRSVVVTQAPTIDGGYINALFSIAPKDSNDNQLYLVRIVLYKGTDLLTNADVDILSNELSYKSFSDDNGEIYCYLPSVANLTLKHQNYKADLSQIWEDDENELFLTLEKIPCSHIAESDDGDCTTAVKCQLCGDIMVSATTMHTYNSAWNYKDANGHAHVCTVSGCNIHDDIKEHTPNIPAATEQAAQYCTVCQYQMAAQLTHTHTPAIEWSSNATHHWKACGGCNVHLDEATHSYAPNNACDTTCEICSAVREVTHDFTGEWEKDANGHWHVCAKNGCSVTDTKAKHTSSGAATETDPEVCNICGWIINPALGHTTHTAEIEWQKNETHHWHECTGCEGQELDKADHNDGDSNGSCDTCGQTMTVPHTHSYGTTWKSDENNHWKECTCGDKANKAAHADGNNDGKCDTCDYEVGASTPVAPNPPVDPGNDDDGLGTGAIIAITVAAVAVGVGGGFILCWFVFRKKVL